MIFEDGNQLRDFVHVSDIVQANLLAMERPEANYEVFNVGSGAAVSVLEIAHRVAAALGRPDLAPEISGRYRVGDIRHCFADITRAQRELAYEPRHDFQAGIADLAEWVAGQAAEDRVEEATRELAARGLTA